MKKLLIMSIAMLAIMATVFTVSAFAANTVTIDSVTLSKYGSADTFNDAYANVTVNYTVTEDTAGAVDRLTFYLAAQDLSSALEGEEAKVIYIDEQVKPETGSLTFVIEKARVLTALNATAAEGTTYTNATVEGLVLTFKLGGTDVDAADSKTVVYNSPTMYGDVTDDGKINLKDSVKIKQKNAGIIETMTAEETAKADVTGDGKINLKDSVKVLQFNATIIETYADLISDRTWAF